MNKMNKEEPCMMMLPAIAALFGASKKMPHQQIRVED
jgi:hypothetical protein